MTTQILDIIKLVAVDDEELNEEDLMNVVDALDQPHHHVIAEESRQQPRQWPRISQTDKNFSMIGVGNFFRFWSHSDWHASSHQLANINQRRTLKCCSYFFLNMVQHMALAKGDEMI